MSPFKSTLAAVITQINAASGKTISVGNSINGAQDVKGLLNLDSLSGGLVNLTADNSADPSAREPSGLWGLHSLVWPGAAIGLDPVAAGQC